MGQVLDVESELVRARDLARAPWGDAWMLLTHEHQQVAIACAVLADIGTMDVPRREWGAELAARALRGSL